MTICYMTLPIDPWTGLSMHWEETWLIKKSRFNDIYNVWLKKIVDQKLFFLVLPMDNHKSELQWRLVMRKMRAVAMTVSTRHWLIMDQNEWERVTILLASLVHPAYFQRDCKVGCCWLAFACISLRQLRETHSSFIL